MKIHFVCTGNTFRSRLAEAYLKSKKIENLEVSSSGTEASRNLNGPICNYTIDILRKNNIAQCASKYWTMTTKNILEQQDLIVFIRKIHYDHCVNKLHASVNNYILWDIPDLSDVKIENLSEFGKTDKEITENIYIKIKEEVDKLIENQFI